MRYLLLCLLVLGLIASFAMADQTAVTKMIKSMPGAIAYYDLEGDYKDALGKAPAGQEVGDKSAFGWISGVNGGKAVTINSAQYVGSFIDIPAPIGSIFDTPKISVIVWVKLFPKDGWQAICERSNIWYLETEAKPAEWKDNAVVWRIYDPVAVGGGGPGQVRDNANVAIKNDQWYQLAFTFDGSVIKCYVNGEEKIKRDYVVQLGPIAGTPDPPPAGKGKNYNLSLGTWQQRDDWFNGAIDDFAYFGTVLSAEQIKALYDAMLASPSPVKAEGKLTVTWGEIKK